MSRLSAEALLLLVTLVWGGTFAVIKTAVEDISPSAFVVTRFSLALIIAVMIWPKALTRLDSRTVGRGLVLGALFGVGFVLQSIGLTLTSASTSAFVTGTMVVFVPFVFRVVEGTRVRPLHMVSVAAVVFGLWLFTQPEVVGINFGDVLTLIAALFWAGYVVYIDKWTKDDAHDADQMHALVILQFTSTIAIAGTSMFLLDGDAASTSWSWPLILGIVYCAVLASVFTTWAQTRFQHRTHPVRAGIIFSMEPIFAAAIAWVALSEAWTPRHAAGAVVLIAAIVIPDLILARKTTP
jgi:drug/metabolite transporter (DMT)-like permease